MEAAEAVIYAANDAPARLFRADAAGSAAPPLIVTSAARPFIIAVASAGFVEIAIGIVISAGETAARFADADSRDNVRLHTRRSIGQSAARNGRQQGKNEPGRGEYKG
jgi:hypothetical protein